MRKKIAIILIAALFLTGCAGGSDVIEIQERFFVNQVNDIILNHNQYLGRTIRYEGIFRTTPGEGANSDIHVVYRYVPGCCGPEGIVGFIVNVGEFEPLLTDAWAEVVGVLEEFEDNNGQTRIHLALTSLTELEERGEEFVTP